MPSHRIESETNQPYLVHVICWAGSDRSRLIAEELSKRGYLATHGGVINGHNFTTPEDLAGVDTIIFADEFTQKRFRQNRRLTGQVKAGKINTLVLGVSEAEKERALQFGEMVSFKKEISEKLEGAGFKYRKMKY